MEYNFLLYIHQGKGFVVLFSYAMNVCGGGRWFGRRKNQRLWQQIFGFVLVLVCLWFAILF